MRISRHHMFMEIAHTVAKRSTCFRESVGAIIVNPDQRIVSMGYNGAPSGEDHCTHHPHGKCDRAIHAEDNAIEHAPYYVDGCCTLYVTHLPCPVCTQKIATCGFISRVFFTTTYGDPESVYTHFDKYDIKLMRILPNGTITDWSRENILDVTA